MGAAAAALDARPDVSTAPLPTPLVFQCRACRAVLGDSMAFAASVRSLGCVLLTGASSLTLDAPPAAITLPGWSHPTTATTLTCAGCGAAVGRRHAPGPGPLPPALAPFAGLFALEVAALASYELGAPALVARVSADGGGGGGGLAAGPAPPADSTGGGGGAGPAPPSDLAARVAALEEEVMRIQAFLLDAHTAAGAGAANGRAGSGIGGLTATGGLTGGANAVAAAASAGPAPAWLAARHASSSSSSAAAAAAAAEVAPEGEATPSLPRGRPPRSAPPRAKPPPRRPLWWWPLGLGAAPPSRRPLYATAARRPPGSPSPPPRPPYSGGKYMPHPYTTGLTPSGRSADGEARLAAALTRPRAKGAPRATPRRPPTEEAKAKRRATMIATGQWKEKKAAPPQAPPPMPAPAARTRTPLPPPLAPSPPPSPALLASVARLASAVDGGAGPPPGPAAFPARPPGRPSAAAWARYCAAKWAARLADPADEAAQAAGFLGRSVRPGEEEDGGGGGGDGGSGGGEGGDADGYFSFMGPRGRRAGSPARGGRSASAGRGGRKARVEASASPPHFPPLAPAAPTRADADAAVAALVEADAVAGAALAARFALPPPPASPAGKGRKAGGGRVDTAAGAAAPHHPPHLPSALPMPASAHVVETLRLLRAARAPLSPTLAALARAPAGLARADAPAALGALAAWLRGTGGDGAGLDPGAVGRVLARIPDVLAGTAPPCVGAAAPVSSSATPTPRVVPPVAAARAVQAYLARLGVPRAEVGGLIARVPRLLARHLDGPAGLEACVAALSGVARLRRGALEGALVGCPAILLAPPPALASRARFAAARLGLGAPAALARAPSLLARSLAVTGPRAELASRKGVRLTAPGEDPAADAASGCGGGGGGGSGAGGASSPTPTPSLSSLPVDALARWSTPRFLAAVGASHAELEEATRAWLGGEGAAWVEAEAGRGAVPKGGAGGE